MGADFVQKKGGSPVLFFIFGRQWLPSKLISTHRSYMDFQDRLEFAFFLSFSTFPENWINLRIMSDKGHSDAPSSSRG